MATKQTLSPPETRSECAPRTQGEIVASLLQELSHRDLVFVARDESRAREIALAFGEGCGQDRVIFCPGSDALPGDVAPPTAANAGQRTSALRQLRIALSCERSYKVALITTGESCGRLYAAPSSFDPAPPIVEIGSSVDPEEFATQMIAIGYFADDRVDEPGEFALRGNVIDIYPADAERPYRVEIVDRTIASIRGYDPVSQRSLEEIRALEVGRASEPPLENGVALLDHLEGATVIMEEGADKRRRSLLALAAEVSDRQLGRAPASFCTDETWRKSLAAHPLGQLSGAFGEPPQRFAEQRSPLRAFAAAARPALDGGKVLLLGSERDLRFLGSRIRKVIDQEIHEVASWRQAIAAPAGSFIQLRMTLSRGFRMGEMLVVAAADLLGSRAERGNLASPIAGLQPFQTGELRCGDVCVHEDHGLCVIDGVGTLPSGGDGLVLRFANDTRRLVPALEADRIWRYGANEDTVALDKLDGSSWQKRRQTIEAALAETAGELARLAAERKGRAAPVLEPDPAAYERFSDGFPFTETADQARAIEAVREDLASGTPMDRLVIGDVGYGKTEVALRAAAIAALAGKQVAVAVPTTVLARQHLETFSARFRSTGLKVAGLSRASSAAEKNAVKAGLADGSIAVVVGTGAIAAKGVRYADLALVIVDEEQRFGAADKTRLRNLGSGHVLTLSATPIPRTLQSALVGLQQLSVITTPPARRQPIRTVVTAYDEQIVRAALLREKSRGGQSFVVAPRIEDLAGLARNLARLVPDLTIVEAHGKMPSAELDEVMVGFAKGKGDVLLATSIIEAGLDVPRANTMIVSRADRFGLSQLHQLRGRVGRGSRRGNILLLTEAGAEIAPRTLARLNTLAAFDRLGAGFAISARDLDLRGAGELLGEEQAGHAKLIGVELYQHLLERAVRRALGDDSEIWPPSLNVGLEGSLPETWIPDVDLRITLYAQLSRMSGVTDVEAFEDELADRFGEIPEEGRRLLALAKLRVLARSAGVERIDAGPAAIALTPRAGQASALEHLGLVKSDLRYIAKGDFADADVRIAAAEELLAGTA